MAASPEAPIAKVKSQLNIERACMSFVHFRAMLSVAGFIIGICFLYRVKMTHDAPEGFCLLILRIIFLCALISFCSVFFAMTILDKEVQQTCLKIGFVSVIAGFFSALLGNFFNCGKSGA